MLQTLKDCDLSSADRENGLLRFTMNSSLPQLDIGNQACYIQRVNLKEHKTEAHKSTLRLILS